MAFKIAGSMALKKAFMEAKPVLLEPIMKVEVTTPDDTLGAVIGDLLIEHPKTRFISFTGSREVGLRINELAAKPRTADLGGILRRTGELLGLKARTGKTGELPAARSARIVVYCRSGNESAIAAQASSIQLRRAASLRGRSCASRNAHSASVRNALTPMSSVRNWPASR